MRKEREIDKGQGCLCVERERPGARVFFAGKLHRYKNIHKMHHAGPKPVFKHIKSENLYWSLRLLLIPEHTTKKNDSIEVNLLVPPTQHEKTARTKCTKVSEAGVCVYV